MSPPPTNSTSDPDLGSAPPGGGGTTTALTRNGPSDPAASSSNGATYLDRAAQLDRSTPLLKQHNPAHHPLAANSHPLVAASHPLATAGPVVHHPLQMMGGHDQAMAANHTPPAAPASNHLYAAAGSNHAARNQFTSPRTHIRESTKVGSTHVLYTSILLLLSIS